MKTIIHWIVYAVAIILTAYLLPGVHVSGFVVALIVAIVLGAVNLVLRPILLVLTLPINILTLGLFTFVINALLILLVSAIIPGFQVDGFGWAILFGIILWVINSLLQTIVPQDNLRTAHASGRDIDRDMS